MSVEFPTDGHGSFSIQCQMHGQPVTHLYSDEVTWVWQLNSRSRLGRYIRKYTAGSPATALTFEKARRFLTARLRLVQMEHGGRYSTDGDNELSLALGRESFPCEHISRMVQAAFHAVSTTIRVCQSDYSVPSQVSSTA
jgi:hypothetical protein